MPEHSVRGGGSIGVTELDVFFFVASPPGQEITVSSFREPTSTCSSNVAVKITVRLWGGLVIANETQATNQTKPIVPFFSTV